MYRMLDDTSILNIIWWKQLFEHHIYIYIYYIYLVVIQQLFRSYLAARGYLEAIQQLFGSYSSYLEAIQQLFGSYLAAS